MSEALAPLEDGNLLALQRSLAHLAFIEDPSLMERDPAAFAAAMGLPPADQRAFQRSQDRLLAYRSFVRNNLAEPIEDTFPITMALLERALAWEDCLDLFLASRSVASPYYRDIAPTFLGWLAATGWGQDRWPFLLQLAHCEVLQSLVEHHPGSPIPAGLHPRAQPEDLVVLAAEAQIVTYDYAVQLASVADPEPAPGTVHLLVHRDAEDEVCWKVLTPATTVLLVNTQARSIGEVSLAMGLPKPSGALALLDGFRNQGAVLGFRAWE